MGTRVRVRPLNYGVSFGISNVFFGFSVQKCIWESVGGNLDADDKIRQAFGDRIGWHVNKNWLQVDDLNFKLLAPVGHLPAVAVRLGGLSWGVDGFWHDIGLSH